MSFLLAIQCVTGALFHSGSTNFIGVVDPNLIVGLPDLARRYEFTGYAAAYLSYRRRFA